MPPAVPSSPISGLKSEINMLQGTLVQLEELWESHSWPQRSHTHLWGESCYQEKEKGNGENTKTIDTFQILLMENRIQFGSLVFV